MTATLIDPPGFTLLDWQKKVIQNDIATEILDQDIERRRNLKLLLEKFTQCMRRLLSEWVPKLIERGLKIPESDQEIANLIFSQPDYKNRSQRDSETLTQVKPFS